jgi:hypothetical protein
MKTTDAVCCGKGRMVRVSGYKPARVGKIVGFEWLGRRGKKTTYALVDFGRPMPHHESGVVAYKPKYLTFVEADE